MESSQPESRLLCCILLVGKKGVLAFYLMQLSSAGWAIIIRGAVPEIEVHGYNWKRDSYNNMRLSQ